MILLIRWKPELTQQLGRKGLRGNDYGSVTRDLEKSQKQARMDIIPMEFVHLRLKFLQPRHQHLDLHYFSSEKEMCCHHVVTYRSVLTDERSLNQVLLGHGAMFFAFDVPSNNKENCDESHHSHSESDKDISHGLHV